MTLYDATTAEPATTEQAEASYQGRALTSDELSLLKTYRTGNPVIWDAASFDIIVRQLMDLGLLQPAGPVSPRACVITDQGREVLERAGLAQP
jgi:hypothetical protein